MEHVLNISDVGFITSYWKQIFILLFLQDAWYYDELDMQEMEGFDDPDPDSDYDYEESYSKRKGKKRASKVARNTDSPAAKKPKVM